MAEACGVRRLVLTHFSQRYRDAGEFAREAAACFGGDIVLAEDLTPVPVPSRTDGSQPRRRPGGAPNGGAEP